MPELPDVEYFKRYFKKTSLNKKIVEIESEAKELIKKITFKDFKRKLIGKSFESTWRRGKFLIIEIKDLPEKLIIHFAMTGDLHYLKQGTEKIDQDRFSRLIFKFTNGYELRWLNLRKFGKVYLVKDPKEVKLIREMGPEPLEFSKEEFFELLREHQNKNIKAFFLDQRDIAGIGNVYSDEIFFRAKVDPHRKIVTLSKKEKEKLFKEMKYVLKKATELTPYQEYPKNWLLSHRNINWQCPRNKNHKLKKEIIASRAAIYCPICQK